jgi:hypothetical protein
LAAANLSYRLLLAGDELVDHPLTAEPQSLPVEHGAVVVPTLGLWGLLAF